MTNPTPTPVAPEHDELSAERLEKLIAEVPSSFRPIFVHPHTEVLCWGDPNDDRENFPLDYTESDELIVYLFNNAPAIVRALRDRDRLAEIVARNTCECGHEAVSHRLDGFPNQRCVFDFCECSDYRALKKMTV